MPTPRRITVAAAPREPITVDLVGKEYVVKPPKAMLGLAIAEAGKLASEDPAAMLAAMNEWIIASFGKSEGKKVIARLSAADDDLDLPEIMDLMQQLTAVATPNPTT